LFANPAFAARRRGGGNKDTAPPVITHEPVAKHDGKGPLVVEATITDASAIFEPTLLVRATGGGPFQRVPMTPKDGAPGVYVAEVPAALLSSDVEYLLEAFDELGNGPARVGDEAAPLKIARDVPAPLVEDKPPPPPAEEGDGSGLVIGAGIAVGTVVVLGAALGVGFAVYALRAPAPEKVSIRVSAPAPVAVAP
jgi:hypothetical protein